MPNAATHAERARMAHQVLRLKEVGIADLSQTAAVLANDPTDASAVPAEGEKQQVHFAGPTHTGIALAVARATDHDLPGPTDKKFIDGLFSATLPEIYALWRENTDENLKANHPEDFEQITEARKLAEESLTEEDLKMAISGYWPSRAGGLRHGLTDLNMANSHYDKGRESFLKGEIAIASDDIRIILVDSADYTVNLASDQFLSSVAGGGRVATSSALSTKTTTAGVFDADDVTLTAVTGDPSECIVIYDHTGGADSARRLIGYIDSATGLPVTPNGGDITVTWDSGSNRIFKL